MTNTAPILLFDGLCNLCVDSVLFVLKHEKQKSLTFSSLQSTFGKEARKKYNIPENIDSLILLHNGKVYYYSAAALKITSFLGGLWPLCQVFLIVPPFIRNYVYKYIARHRYSWFGQKEICWLPTPELESRFIK